MITSFKLNGCLGVSDAQGCFGILRDSSEILRILQVLRDSCENLRDFYENLKAS